MYYCFYQSKKGGKDQESIKSSTTADPGYHIESYKTQLKITKRAKMSALSQQVTKRQQWTDAKAWKIQNITRGPKALTWAP